MNITIIKNLTFLPLPTAFNLSNTHNYFTHTVKIVILGFGLICFIATNSALSKVNKIHQPGHYLLAYFPKC